MTLQSEICAALEGYNQSIESLKKEMKNAEVSTDLIRKDIRNLRQNYGFINNGHLCDLCGYSLLAEPFYIFPCEHTFHTRCFMIEMRPILDENRAKELKILQSKLDECGLAQSV
jgi:vacuolar protein sorting-associated protein 18